jgi:hypothetical protein
LFSTDAYWTCVFKVFTNVISAVTTNGGSEISQFMVRLQSGVSPITGFTVTSSSENLPQPVNSAAKLQDYQMLRQKYDCLVKEYSLLNRAHNTLKCKYTNALRKVRQLSRSKVAFESSLGRILNHDQRSALSKKSTRGSKWSSVTVKNALKLHYACGPSGYKELLCQRYPLSSHRTLLRSMQHVQFDSGILNEVFHYLTTKTSSMKDEERECRLTLDKILKGAEAKQF